MSGSTVVKDGKFEFAAQAANCRSSTLADPDPPDSPPDAPMPLLADTPDVIWLTLLDQYTIIGLTYGSLFALIALGYTMVYGIVELINFAHGDLFMLGSFLALTVVGARLGVTPPAEPTPRRSLAVARAASSLRRSFCAALNVGVDRVVYKPLRNAPRSSPRWCRPSASASSS